jgi:DNA integrity scanning protein DisA with diadenylate cyclase activity
MDNHEIVKIQALVPPFLWVQLESFRFKSKNEAVNYAFEKLIEKKEVNQSELTINQIESIINQNEPNMVNQIQVRLKEGESQIREIRAQNEILIQNMNNQIELLISQLSKKDEQIEKQSYHIQTLIQENGKLNIKLLPEKTEYNKPWWRFW